MAPSRALPLLRRTASTSTRFRPLPLTSLFSTTHSISNRTVSPATGHSRTLEGFIARSPRNSQTPLQSWRRTYSSSSPTPPDYLSEAELTIFNKIVRELAPAKLEVQDISGGCGSMYALEIESSRFEGLSVIKQHKMVNEVLKEEIKGWHGVQLRTRPA